MIECRKCNKSNPDDSGFCSRCGSPLRVNENSGSTNRGNPATKVILFVVLVVVGLEGWGFYKSIATLVPKPLEEDRSIGTPASGYVNPNLAPVSTPQSENVSALQDLKVVKWSFVPARGLDGESTYSVSGELKNNSSQYFRGVFLEVALYNSHDDIIATSTVSAQNIGPGQTGIVSGYVIDKTQTRRPKGRLRVSSGF